MKHIVSIYKKIKLWGAKGILDFLLNKYTDWKVCRFLSKNAHTFPVVPQTGITILADLTRPSSLSKVMRDLAFALKRAGVPFQAFDLHPQNNIPQADVKSILTPANEFQLLKYDHVIEMFSSPLPKNLPLKRSKVVFWEFTTGLLEYNPAIADGTTVIAMSDFNHDVFRQILPPSIDVRKVLYPFFFDASSMTDKAETRRRYGIPDNAFVVFFNFDYGSSFNRKNPDGSIRAFAKAFSGYNDTYLVFKTKGASQHLRERSQLLRLATELSVNNRIIMVDNYIPQHDIYGLTGACDVYLSLHRGEGFGLGIAEAMSLGKAVIVTDYSSTTEFCNHDNAILVPYKIVPVKKSQIDNNAYKHVTSWADPDIDAAANALNRLYHDKNYRDRLGAQARSYIYKHFSLEEFKKSIEELLHSA